MNVYTEERKQKQYMIKHEAKHLNPISDPDVQLQYVHEEKNNSAP